MKYQGAMRRGFRRRGDFAGARAEQLETRRLLCAVPSPDPAPLSAAPPSAAPLSAVPLSAATNT